MAPPEDRPKIRRLADTLAHALREVATPERAISEKAYLKSDLVHYGATVPATRAIAKAFAKGQPEMTRAELAALVEELRGRLVRGGRGARRVPRRGAAARCPTSVRAVTR